jgi:hypothetical protein
MFGVRDSAIFCFLYVVVRCLLFVFNHLLIHRCAHLLEDVFIDPLGSLISGSMRYVLATSCFKCYDRAH